jgi:uncharacterized protein with NRDE domain
VCLVVFASDPFPSCRLAVGANRDEFHRRPAAAADRWPEVPGLFAGRDLEAGGTWLGVTGDGRIAALTNFRDGPARPMPRSRGELVVECLRARDEDAALCGLAERAGEYGGFTLLAGRPGRLRSLSSRSRRLEEVPGGIHALSNRDLDTPWPKAVRTRDALSRLVEAGRFGVEEVFGLLGDRRQAPDAELPDTGVGIALERFLSPPFIVGPDYGTRSSTVVLFFADGTVSFAERSFGPDGQETGRVLARLGTSG